MCFSGDIDDFAGDIVDTEVELFTDIDELSVSSCFYRSGRVLWILQFKRTWTRVGVSIMEYPTFFIR